MVIPINFGFIFNMFQIYEVLRILEEILGMDILLPLFNMIKLPTICVIIKLQLFHIMVNKVDIMNIKFMIQIQELIDIRVTQDPKFLD